MSAHTAGPWAVGDCAAYSVWAGNTQVASCRWFLDDGNFAPECAGDYEGRANAALIAAAPDLLAALSCIVLNARLQPDAHMAGTTDCYAIPTDDIEAARAVIAKATGRK